MCVVQKPILLYSIVLKPTQQHYTYTTVGSYISLLKLARLLFLLYYKKTHVSMSLLSSTHLMSLPPCPQGGQCATQRLVSGLRLELRVTGAEGEPSDSPDTLHPSFPSCPSRLPDADLSISGAVQISWSGNVRMFKSEHSSGW